MPSDDGRGFYECNDLRPTGPYARQEHPERAIDGVQARPRRRASKDRELLARREVLDDETCARTERRDERADDCSQEHGRDDGAASRECHRRIDGQIRGRCWTAARLHNPANPSEKSNSPPQGTLRRELLDHVIVLGERHLLRLVRDYVAYYNADLPHLSLDADSPSGRAIELRDLGSVIALPRAGGLHHRYARAA